jgi:DNA repair exonuclease SbcCD ATPase subunit
LVDAPDQTAWAGQSAAGDTFPTEADLTNLKKRTGALEARRKQHQTLQEAINEVAQKRTLPQERRRSVERAEQAIPAAWTALATPEFLSENALGLLRHEQENLKGADERARDLDEATRGLNALRDRLHEIIADIEKMPNEACRPAQEVRAEQTKAESERDKANSEARAAQNETEQLRKQREEHDILAKKRDDARRDEGLYKTLTELLGPDKLQSYLLRGAEEAIVEHANEALTAFSGGTLRLARRAESDAVDQASATGVTGDKKRKALDLLCSNTETADAPLPLHNLSGSQKFRVAVALALGIGQFASASDARIQSVIIDEGFGSLDPQNQSDMARELRGLADRLERIIVVSHQETFADGFDDRIHVTLGEEGSRAEPLLA